MSRDPNTDRIEKNLPGNAQQESRRTRRSVWPVECAAIGKGGSTQREQPLLPSKVSITALESIERFTLRPLLTRPDLALVVGTTMVRRINVHISGGGGFPRFRTKRKVPSGPKLPFAAITTRWDIVRYVTSMSQQTVLGGQGFAGTIYDSRRRLKQDRSRDDSATFDIPVPCRLKKPSSLRTSFSSSFYNSVDHCPPVSPSLRQAAVVDHPCRSLALFHRTPAIPSINRVR